MPDLRNLLTGLLPAAVSVFVTLTILALLLARLGDESGAGWASRGAVFATGVTILALSAGFLVHSTERRDRSATVRNDP